MEERIERAKTRKFVGQSTDSIIRERGQKQLMQRQSLTIPHKQINAQSASEQQPLGKARPVPYMYILLFFLIAEHNVI